MQRRCWLQSKSPFAPSETQGIYKTSTHIQPEQSFPSETPDRALKSRGSSRESSASLAHINPAMVTPVSPTAQTTLFPLKAVLFALLAVRSVSRAAAVGAVSAHRNVRRGTACNRRCDATLVSRVMVSNMFGVLI